jgi:hypothetical protein
MLSVTFIYWHAECHNVELIMLSIIILNVITLNAIKLKVTIPSGKGPMKKCISLNLPSSLVSNEQ